VPIGNKEYGHVMSITQDITKRKQAEKQEAEHAEIMTLIAKDETPIVIFERIVANLEARNTDLICSVLLLSEDGHCLMHAVAPSLPDFYNAAINGVEIGPNNGSCGVAAFTGELVIVEDISSHPYWMNYKHLAERAGVKSCWSQPFKGSDGRVLGTFAIYSRHVCAPTEVDIKQIVTASQLSAIVVERMLSQNQLQELNRTLESKVEERTRDLEAAKLEAEISNKAKSDFLSHMSHEIRTPMNSIIGMSYLALQNETHPKQRDYLQKIHYSGEHLLDLINNILDLSKIERSMLVLDKQSFALNKVTERLNTLFHLPAIEKGIELSFHLDPEIPTFLHGDLQHLNQVLVNLTGNALKFTSQGNVVIRAHLLSQDEQCCWVRFEVEDSGIGIKKDLQAKLFQPFVQGDSSITRIYGGTGLGLTISKKLIELMGGAVGLQSTLQKGTTFWFDIPLGVSDGALVDITNEDLIDYALLANAQILLAEDNLFNQQVAKGLLEYVGTKVVVASNGLEAIDLILKHELPFDCVLMDMQMPEMDGIEATRIIRRSSQGERLPIIALTANISKEDYDACYDVGMSDFISKPVSPLLLYATVCKWVRAQKKHT
jgi:signal transduction histidine kinase/ActR/RegA family two-component response regulator